MLPAFDEFIKSIHNSFNTYESKIRELESTIALKENELTSLNNTLIHETAHLKNAHAELSKIFNYVNEGFFTKDIPANNYLDMSVGCEKIYGYRIDDFFANSNLWYEVIHPQDKMLVEHEDEILSKGGQSNTTYRIIHKDGSTRWIEVKAIPLFIDGKLTRIDGVVNDVTERKNAEQALIENEEKYRSLVEQASDAIFINTENGELIDANQSACDMLGYSKNEFSGLNVSKLFPLEEMSLYSGYRGMQPGQIATHEGSLLHRSGTLVPVDISSKKLLDRRIITIARNLSERRKTEKILLASEEKTRLIMGAALDAIICMDINDTITFWNPQAAKIFGWKEPEVIGKSLSSLIIPAPFRQMHREGLKRYLASGEGPALNVLLELSAVNRDGQEFPVELTVLPIKQAGEEFFCAFIRDISGRKQAEKRIIDSERRYRTVFEQNLAGVFQTTAKGEIINCNNAFAKMLGYNSPADLIDTNAVDLYFTPGEREAFIETLRVENKLYNYEVVLRSSNGSRLYMLENISLFKDPNTGEEICDGIIIDITERKKAEALLQESEKRYRQIVETAQEGIWLTDENYLTIFVNKKMSELLEYSVEELVGKPPTFFMDEEGAALATISLARRRQGFSEKTDIPFVTKSGRQLWTNLSSSPVIDNEGKYIGSLAMVTDITKRKSDEELIKQSEANLDLKNKELKRKNTELEQFAYVASHDLQEPLRTTSSFVKLLHQQYKGKLDEKADKYLSFIIESSDRMKVLINDLLDYSRIGTKNELQQVDCNKVMQDVIADLNRAITDAAARVSVDALPVINGYPTEIKQLFQNLTINAIKFRKKDETLTLKISATRKESSWLFAFEDNGIGIDKAHNERIFIIFQRLHTRTEYQGSGIGLSHCKKIVELHNGKIWVESTPGTGSTFLFSLPIQTMAV